MSHEAAPDSEYPETWRDRIRAVPTGFWWFLLGLSLLVVPFLVRTWFLWGIPDIGDPFDVSAFSADMVVAPDEDSLAAYHRAAELYVQEMRDFSMKTGLSVDASMALSSTPEGHARLAAILKEGWGVANEDVREWVELHQLSLKEFLLASKMPDPRFVMTDDLLTTYGGNGYPRFYKFINLAQLQGRRCEAEGNYDEALDCYLAILSFRRDIHVFSDPREDWLNIVHWAALPDVTEEQLRTAMDKLRWKRSQWRPASHFVKANYVRLQNSLQARDGLATAIRYRTGTQFPMPEREAMFWRILFWVVGEPERTRRLNQHLTANLLRAVDQPAATRPKPFFLATSLVYLDDRQATLPQGHLSSSAINHTIQTSAIHRHLEYLPGFTGASLFVNQIGDCSLLDSVAYPALLEVMLALQAHHREHRAFPEKIDELLPSFLSQIPIDPCDPTGLPIRYRVDDESQVTVWSVGANGVDNNAFRNWLTGDEVIIVTAPEKKQASPEMPPPSALEPSNK